ncbi:efflux transporter outer membrane subunit [Ottowia testudinis]|uniref:efflux transporter outer membrane subunit n=1 Tax=Ottowia testudinis TaxID=2816950 RepID=UPI003D660E09
MYRRSLGFAALNPTCLRGSFFAPFAYFSRRAVVLLLAALATACSLAPVEQSPTVPLPTAWKTAAPAAGWISADAAHDWRAGRWWALWPDPVLDTLMQRIDVGNQNLAAALANVDQAQALLRQQQAQLWPTVGASAGQQRSGGQDQSTSQSASLGLNVSWAPDLWGRLGDAARAQGASVQASEADLGGVRLAAQASLAQAYFNVRELDAEMALLDEIITGYERAAMITQNRYDVGVAARTDTLQAQSTLDNARASRVALARGRALAEHAIALLVGEPPVHFNLPPAPWEGSVPGVPAGVPSELLLRRPDVAAAERRVAAANARIGVARAAYFPQLTLTGGLSAGGSHLIDVVSAPKLLWSLGLSLAQYVFDGGARTAAVDQAIAAHDAATASYRQSALTAMKEVEDQLTTLQTLAEQIERVRASAGAAARVEQQVMNRYQSGLAAYTEVVTAQASALGARRSLMQLQLQRQQAALALVQALGGGWQAHWAVRKTGL